MLCICLHIVLCVLQHPTCGLSSLCQLFIMLLLLFGCKKLSPASSISHPNVCCETGFIQSSLSLQQRFSYLKPTVLDERAYLRWLRGACLPPLPALEGLKGDGINTSAIFQTLFPGLGARQAWLLPFIF